MSTELQPTETHTESEALTSRSKHLTAADIRVLLEMKDGGYNQVEIAKVIGCSQGTVSRTLKQFEGTAEQVARQLRGLTDESIASWRKAKTIAAKRGDHRPAKELIEMAYPELRPQPQANNHGGVTVIVAMPGGGETPRPVIAKTLDLSPVHPKLEGEGQ